MKNNLLLIAVICIGQIYAMEEVQTSIFTKSFVPDFSNPELFKNIKIQMLSDLEKEYSALLIEKKQLMGFGCRSLLRAVYQITKEALEDIELMPFDERQAKKDVLAQLINQINAELELLIKERNDLFRKKNDQSQADTPFRLHSDPKEVMSSMQSEATVQKGFKQEQHYLECRIVAYELQLKYFRKMYDILKSYSQYGKEPKVTQAI